MSREIARLFADARHILDETARSLDQAMNAFDYDGQKLDQWDAVTDLLLRFDWHLLQTLLHITPLTAYPKGHMEVAKRQCLKHILESFGPSGPHHCFERIRNGVDGGAPAVLREFGQKQSDAFGQNQIDCMISAYWDRLTVEQKLQAPLDYLADYAALVPQGMTEGSAARIRAYFPEILKAHIQAARKLERIGHE